jgi:hypothetical protein
MPNHLRNMKRSSPERPGCNLPVILRMYKPLYSSFVPLGPSSIALNSRLSLTLLLSLPSPSYISTGSGEASPALASPALASFNRLYLLILRRRELLRDGRILPATHIRRCRWPTLDFTSIRGRVYADQCSCQSTIESVLSGTNHGSINQHLSNEEMYQDGERGRQV